jgi:hypothetical protein
VAPPKQQFLCSTFGNRLWFNWERCQMDMDRCALYRSVEHRWEEPSSFVDGPHLQDRSGSFRVAWLSERPTFWLQSSYRGVPIGSSNRIWRSKSLGRADLAVWSV